MSVCELPFLEQRIEGTPDCVFILLHSTYVDPITLQETPILLFVNRRDGRIGFPGGKVEGMETLKEAAIRELKEELRFPIYSGNLNPFVVFSDNGYISHYYETKIPLETMKSLFTRFPCSQAFPSEISGIFSQPLSLFTNKEKLCEKELMPESLGLSTFLNYSNFASQSVQEVILRFLKFLKLPCPPVKRT